MSDEEKQPSTRSADDPESEPSADQPGVAELRDAIARHSRRLLEPPTSLREDGIAGLSVAVANVPDGMANGLLVGVNPIHGLYATMVGPLVGGLVSSTQLMVITTTAAASLTANQSLAGASAESRTAALFMLVILAGVFQILIAAFRLDRLTRFVSYSVLTGFLAGISVLLVLSQVPTVTGYDPEGRNRVAQTIDTAAHATAIDLTTVAVAAGTLLLAILLPRTPLRAFGRLVAIVVPSAIVAFAGLESVEVVSDLGTITRSIPLPELPSLESIPAVITGALSVALVVLVQGVGVSHNVPIVDGRQRSGRRDIMAQGAANVASGLFQGLPVGGSLSATAIGVIAGARTRWTSLVAGFAMAVIVIAVPQVVGPVAMPSLGALLIIAGISGLKPRELWAVSRTGWPSLIAASVTFLATLFLPIQVAVALGVVLSALLHVTEVSTNVNVYELVERSDGRIEERSAPSRLESNRVTTLGVRGNLFFAGANTLERRLPSPRGAERPVVVLRLRGRDVLGATLIDVLARYADALKESGGRLYLSGISSDGRERMERTGKIRFRGRTPVHQATSVLGESTREARAEAEAWLVDSDEES